jgi:hypothetical protein
LAWILAAVLAISSGLFCLRFLTVHPLEMSRYLLAACGAAFAWVAVLTGLFRGTSLWIALAASPILFVAGYAVAARAVLSREDPRQVPELVRKAGDPGQGHTAVVYFTHGEPETYDPIGWINQFREFDEQGIRFVPFLARPFFLHALRTGYLRVGKSDHRGMHRRMLASLEQAYRAQGDRTTRFYISFLDDHPRPDAAVIRALNEGASRVVVSEVFLTVSNHTAEGKELIEALDVERYGALLRFTGPLWDSETLQGMFLQRANDHLDGVDKSQVGVLLVGHGQPAEWDAKWPTETEQEIGFRQRVLDRFEADGYCRENLGLAWMEFREPKPAKLVRKFLENGVRWVVYFAAAISADSMHSQYDVPRLVEEARVPEGFPLINLGAWNDDPIVIRAIKAKIDAQMIGPTL